MSESPFGATLKKVGGAGKDSPAPEPKSPFVKADDKPPKSPFLKGSAGDDKPPKSASFASKRETESPSPGLKSPFLSKATEDRGASVTSAADSSSPFGAKRSQRQSLEAPGRKESPVLKESVAGTATNDQLDKSVVSMSGKTEATAQAISRKGSQASVHSKASETVGAPTNLSRQASAISAGPDPEIAIEEALSEHGSRPPSRANSTVQSVRSQHTAYSAPQLDLADENNKLKAQIESLQRLMASGNQENKIHRLQEDLKEKAHKVKELETELKKSQDEAKKWKAEASKKAKKSHHKDTHDISTPVHHDSKALAERDERIHELEEELAMAREAARRAEPGTTPVRIASHATSHSDGPSPPKVRVGEVRTEVRYDTQATHEVNRLKQVVTEKEASITLLSQKLERAQEAILSSAGVGWEAHVKLHQTKGMLGKMLRATSPEGERRKSVSASREGSHPRHGVGSMIRFKVGEDEHGKLRLFKIINDEKAIVTSLRYSNSAMYDQTGAVMPLADMAKDEIPRLAALADMCGVAHNISSNTPVVVVAGHNISSPASSPYKASPHSPHSPLANSQSPLNSSRYRSPTRRGY